ncbi:uncharacterized protein BXZ73DRAFT_103887 [Epithele typhae]|uniref:uncharacterized protein n=1 Tax=Epithele typhae TaxID=378194 RepID=UPI002007D4F8|nr:uncharacterized protein BXZ73DRAFT_103887 [Epithele typhae]KAH9923452.1 hypothetical protein BXZ73DRAFT_103887 [Epithele typhae]
MSIELVSRLSTNVTALEASARELRNSLTNADASVLHVDLYTPQDFLQRFTSYYEDYRGIVSRSESFSTKLAATIKVYIAQQANLKDPEETEDTIDDLQALQTAIKSMDFDLSPSFSTLVESYRQLFEEMEVALTTPNSDDAPEVAESQADSEIPNIQPVQPRIACIPIPGHSTKTAKASAGHAQPTVRSKPSKSKMDALPPLPSEGEAPVSQRRPFGPLNTGSEPNVPPRGPDPQLPKTHSGTPLSPAAKPAHEAPPPIDQDKYTRARASVDGLPALLELVQAASTRDTERVKAMFSDVANALAKEIDDCLEALDAIKKDPSTDNQRSVAIMDHTLATSVVHWKEVIAQLDKFARSAK